MYENISDECSKYGRVFRITPTCQNGYLLALFDFYEKRIYI